MQRTPDTLKKQTIATILQQPSYQDIDWRQLMQEGLLIQITIRRCRFTAKLELADLGVTLQDARVLQAVKRTVVLGEKRLLPETYMGQLSRIEGSARRLLAKNSFRTELGSFLPVSAYKIWKQENEAIKQRYFQLRDEILTKYDDLAAIVLNQYRTLAEDTYTRIQAINPGAIGEPREAFVEGYCRRIQALIPTPDRIRETFAFEVALINGVKRIDELIDPNDTNLQPVQLRNQAAALDQQREQMQRDLLQQIEEKKSTAIDTFLSSIVIQLRSMIYDAMTDVLGSMARLEQRNTGRQFPPQSVTQLKNLVFQIQQLNFYGDQDIERMLTQIQTIIDQKPAKRQRSIADIREKICAIATLTRATLLDLGTQPRSARTLDVPDLPEQTEVRAARQQLGLDLDERAFQQVASSRAARLVGQPSLLDYATSMRAARLA